MMTAISYIRSAWSDKLYQTASAQQCTARQLGESGAKVDIKNNNGLTALMRAATRDHIEAVKALLKLGANPKEEAASGETAAHLAKKQGHLEIVDLLLDKWQS